jgi:hypothetical protein
MRLALIAFSLFSLASCKNLPEAVQQAQDFYAQVDSSHFDKVYDQLVDEEKALLSQADFIKLLSDSSRVPGFDSTDDWAVVSTSGNETVVRAYRHVPSWDAIDGIKTHKSRRELLKGLAESGNLPQKKDTTRVVAVVKTPQGPRFRVGLKDILAFSKAKEQILRTLAGNVTVSLKSGVVENNFQAFFHVTGSVKNAGDIDLKPVTFQVFIRGKLSGTTVLTDLVPAKGAYSGEMISTYEDGLTPQKFGTSWDRGAVNLGGLSVKVLSASPAEAKDLDRLVLRSLGGNLVSPPSLF